MTFDVIDYIAECFAEGGLPARITGKFVVLRNGEHRVAVFAPRELAVYHANIVERFLAGRGIAGRYNPRGDAFRPATDAWHIEGGGLWDWDRAGGLVEIYGRSRSYGSVELDLLAADLRETGAFDGATVVARR